MKKLFSKIRFGVVHMAKGGFPAAAVAVNVIEAFSGKDLATGKSKSVNWQPIALKIAGLIAFLYLVKEGFIPVEEFLKFIKDIL